MFVSDSTYCNTMTVSKLVLWMKFVTVTAAGILLETWKTVLVWLTARVDAHVPIITVLLVS